MNSGFALSGAVQGSGVSMQVLAAENPVDPGFDLAGSAVDSALLEQVSCSGPAPAACWVQAVSLDQDLAAALPLAVCLEIAVGLAQGSVDVGAPVVLARFLAILTGKIALGPRVVAVVDSFGPFAGACEMI